MMASRRSVTNRLSKGEAQRVAVNLHYNAIRPTGKAEWQLRAQGRAFVSDEIAESFEPDQRTINYLALMGITRLSRPRALYHRYLGRPIKRIRRLLCGGAARSGAPEGGLQMSRMLALACVLAAFALAAGSASAQQPSGTSQQPAPTPPYGPPITLEQAKRVMAAAELEAAKNSWQVAVTILDSGGNMVMFHKLDNTQLASIGVSEGKANTALRFKRPSKALDDAIAAGGAGLRLLAVKDITPLEGGLPVILDGTIIGAIGVSGALSSQDAQVARAGAAAVVK
jgi:glc operon protein GlcG